MIRLASGLLLGWIVFISVAASATIPTNLEKALLQAKSADDFFSRLEPVLERGDFTDARDRLGQDAYAPWKNVRKTGAQSFELRIAGENIKLEFLDQQGQKFRVNGRTFETKDTESPRETINRILNEAANSTGGTSPLQSLFLPRAHAAVPILLGLMVTSAAGAASAAYWGLSTSCDPMAIKLRETDPIMKKLIELAKECRQKSVTRQQSNIRQLETAVRRAEGNVRNPQAASQARLDLENAKTRLGELQRPNQFPVCSEGSYDKNDETYTGANDTAAEKYNELLGVLEQPVASRIARACPTQLAKLRERRDEMKHLSKVLGMNFHLPPERVLPQGSPSGRN